MDIQKRKDDSKFHSDGWNGRRKEEGEDVVVERNLRNYALSVQVKIAWVERERVSK